MFVYVVVEYGSGWGVGGEEGGFKGGGRGIRGKKLLLQYYEQYSFSRLNFACWKVGLLYIIFYKFDPIGSLYLVFFDKAVIRYFGRLDFYGSWNGTIINCLMKGFLDTSFVLIGGLIIIVEVKIYILRGQSNLDGQIPPFLYFMLVFYIFLKVFRWR